MVMCCLVVSISGIGLAMIYYSWTNLQKARASLNWPVTDRRIVASRFVPNGDGDRTAKLDYVYTLDKHEYSSHVVVFGGLLGDGGATGTHVRRYPQGKSVSVSYDPNDLTSVCLEPGVENHNSLILGLFAQLPACLMGVAIVLLGVKAGRATFEKQQRDLQDAE